MEINSVYKKQNKNDNIEMLMAVRRLYSKAKFINKINFLFSVIVPVVISLVKVFIDKYELLQINKFIPYLGYYGIAILAFTIITNGMVSDLKKKAALIQEMFDCDVLSIRWNDIKVGKKPSYSIIYKSSLYHKNKNRHSEFQNWYFDQEYKFKTSTAAILCQNENVGWDLSQRIVLSKILISILCLSFLSLLGVGFYFQMKVDEFFFYIVFLLPLLRHFYIQFKENKATIEKCTRINEAIEKVIDTLASQKEIENQELTFTIRTIQDEIYSHRASNQPVPDLMHKLFRKKNEEQYKRHFNYYLDKLDC
ncbi:S-4TM family putative pore-forming effector [Pectobacterium aroidearum]|uniref:S-4TM family putative pore-forming effector n=1 Tax=Pectobacterium aroidearum TaxID=1201031 RepID=UPI0032ECFB9B